MATAADERFRLYLRVSGDDLPSLATLNVIARSDRVSAILIGAADTAQADKLAEFTEAAQRQNLAVLIDENIAFARQAGADGVHSAADPQKITSARETLGKDALIGVTAPLSRHDAMVLVEAGADYVAFGMAGGGNGAMREDGLEMIAWWAEMFEVPCVAWLDGAYGAGEIRRLADAGADYLAVQLDAFMTEDAFADFRD